MKTREEYDTIINDMKDKLGEENFALISDIVADLSTDYDGVIQADKSYQDEISKLNETKISLLETNNKLFSKIGNSNEEKKDPIIKEKEKEIAQENLTINDVIDSKGGLN